MVFIYKIWYYKPVKEWAWEKSGINIHVMLFSNFFLKDFLIVWNLHMIKKFSLIRIEAAISFSDYEEAENIKNQTALGNNWLLEANHS